MKRKLIQRLRTLGIHWSCTLMDWNSRIRYADLNHEIGWRDYLRWRIEDKLTGLFAWAYDGSDEELRSVDQDEIPVEYMSPRQLKYFLEKEEA